MKKVIALMLGLAAGTASFAQTNDPNAGVVITSANERVTVHITPQQAKASIKLFDSEGRLIHTHTADVTNGFRQKLNLTQLAPGSYRLAVVKNGQTVEKTVIVKDIPAQKEVLIGA